MMNKKLIKTALIVALAALAVASGCRRKSSSNYSYTGPSAWDQMTPAEKLQTALADEIDLWWGFDGVADGWVDSSIRQVRVDGALSLDYYGGSVKLTRYGLWRDVRSTYSQYVGDGFTADTWFGLSSGVPYSLGLSFGYDSVRQESVVFGNERQFELQADYIDFASGTQMSGVIVGRDSSVECYFGCEYGYWDIYFDSPSASYTTDTFYNWDVTAQMEWSFYLFPIPSTKPYYYE